jgi:hypothetical protein
MIIFLRWYNGKEANMINHSIVVLDSVNAQVVSSADRMGDTNVVLIQNVSESGNVYLGGAGVSTSSFGLRLPPGGNVEIKFSRYDTLYAVGDVGTSVSVTAFERFVSAPMPVQFSLVYPDTLLSYGAISEQLTPTVVGTRGGTKYYAVTSGSLPSTVTFDRVTGAFTGPASWPFPASFTLAEENANWAGAYPYVMSSGPEDSIITSGVYWGTINFGDTSVFHDPYTQYGMLYLGRQNKDGSWLWRYDLGVGSIEQIIPISGNNYIVTGHAAAGDLQLGSHTITEGNGFLAKIDADGNWSPPILQLASSYSAWLYKANDDTFIYVNPDSNGIYRFNGAGELVWISALLEGYGDIRITDDGVIYVVGQIWSASITVGPFTVTPPPEFNGSKPGVYVTRLDSNGVPEWVVVNPALGQPTVYALDGNGAFYVIPNGQSSVQKISASGISEWVAPAATSSQMVSIASMAILSGGKVAVTGNFQQEATFGVHVVTPAVPGETNYYLSIIDESGQWQSSQFAGHGLGANIINTSSGAAIFNAISDLPVTIGGETVTPASGSADSIIARINNDGTIGWVIKTVADAGVQVHIGSWQNFALPGGYTIFTGNSSGNATIAGNAISQNLNFVSISDDGDIGWATSAIISNYSSYTSTQIEDDSIILLSKIDGAGDFGGIEVFGDSSDTWVIARMDINGQWSWAYVTNRTDSNGWANIDKFVWHDSGAVTFFGTFGYSQIKIGDAPISDVPLGEVDQVYTAWISPTGGLGYGQVSGFPANLTVTSVNKAGAVATDTFALDLN